MPTPTSARLMRVVAALALLLPSAGCSSKDRSTGSSAPALSAPAAIAPGSAPFDISGVIRRVHFAYRAEGERFAGGHDTYSAEVRAGKVALRPFNPRHGEVVRGAPLELETVGLGRATASHVDGDGSLLLRRGAAVERLRNGDEGVEQSWTFAHRPSGEGDLVVRVRAGGLRYAGASAQGLHFEDPATGLGFRYGRATWVEADGRRTELGAARFDGGEIVLAVPAGLVQRSRYPATLDPVISPEFGMDQPVVSPASSAQSSPAVAFDGTNYLVVWTDHRHDASWRIYGAHVAPDGTVLDNAGIAISAGPGDQAYPAVAWNGAHYLVVWASVDGAQDVHGARLDPAGEVLDPSGINLSAASGQQLSPAVASDGNHFLVVWTDAGSGNSDIRGSRVGDDGRVLDPGGITLASGAQNQAAPPSPGTGAATS